MITTATQHHEPLTQEDLFELESFLASDITPEDCMPSLEMIDGFMAALVVGPELVDREMWLPYLLNPEQRRMDFFETPEQQERITSLLERHLGTVAEQFVTDPEAFLPIYEMFGYAGEDERDLAIEEWSIGFILGIELCHEAWQPLFEHEEQATLVGPFFILGKITDDYSTMTPAEKDEMVDILTDSVIRLHAFWRNPA